MSPSWRTCSTGTGEFAYYTVLFCAFWMTWTCFTLYGNVAGDRTRTHVLLAGMFGLAVMAAAVKGVRDGRHIQAFAAVYVLMRILGSRVWQVRGQVLLDWPTAQFTLGVIPWTVSVWVDRAARFWLWTAGIALDLWATFGINGRRFLERTQQRAVGRRSRPVKLSAVYSDPAHLGERLGLFVLIVLGEGVAQLVATSADTEWDWQLCGLALGAFLLLVMMWSLSPPVARGLVRVRDAAAAAREIMIHLPMDSLGVATLQDRWRSVTRHLLAGVGCDLGQIVFPYLDRCTDLERRKILETVSTYLDTGSLGDTGRVLRGHRNTVLNRLNAFEKYTGLDVQRPYDAAAVTIALEWQGTRP
ncbi:MULTISPECIES: low temperature requirement protein A [Streptomyces]|uniref:low temperature requirement protein A n=1 Tax=Streptomyces lycopersici TaxID=2974589 RepID=UPI0021CEADED|nr:low temperature requirement protein A [Streptomyces sp. NEAU-383]